MYRERVSECTERVSECTERFSDCTACMFNCVWTACMDCGGTDCGNHAERTDGQSIYVHCTAVGRRLSVRHVSVGEGEVGDGNTHTFRDIYIVYNCI